jgi:hypothetical protein
MDQTAAPWGGRPHTSWPFHLLHAAVLGDATPPPPTRATAPRYRLSRWVLMPLENKMYLHRGPSWQGSYVNREANPETYDSMGL